MLIIALVQKNTQNTHTNWGDNTQQEKQTDIATKEPDK